MKHYKIQVLYSTSDFRGDHEADVMRAIHVEPWETVGQLVLRTLAENEHRQKAAFRVGDHLQIRIALDTSRAHDSEEDDDG